MPSILLIGRFVEEMSMSCQIFSIEQATCVRVLPRPMGIDSVGSAPVGASYHAGLPVPAGDPADVLDALGGDGYGGGDEPL